MALPKNKTLKKSKSPTSAALIEALKFVSLAQKKDGNPFQTHCLIANQTIVAYDGVLTAGVKIEEDLSVCVNTLKLIDALERCNKTVSITQVDMARLKVASGAFSAFVPCYHEDMPLLVPDSPICDIDDRLKTGFDMIAHLSDDKEQKVVLSSILLKSGSMCSTDGACLLEYWHGIDLPELILPTSFISAIMKVKAPLAKFGYSGNSITFWYENGAWIKTQVYDEEWPPLDHILNQETKPLPLQKGFFEGVMALEAFAEGKEAAKVIYFYENELRTSRTEGEGATYQVEGLPFGPAFSIKKLKRIQHCVKSVDWFSSTGAYFFGDNLRGVLMGVAK
jgi:hypothetical protein